MHEIKTESGKMMMMSPPPGVCQKCAKPHTEIYPHDAQSFYYQMYMLNVEGRPATRAEAMKHCSEEIKGIRTKELAKYGIDIHSTEVTPKKNFTSKRFPGE